jgi:hypothetical protein
VEELNGLRRGIPVLFTESEAEIRQEMLALLSRMLRRIKAAMFKMYQKRHRENADQVANRQSLPNTDLDTHKNFVTWLAQSITDHLHPEAGYQRHIFSLKLLSILVKSELDVNSVSNSMKNSKMEAWVFKVNIFTPTLNRTLKDFVMNPFEDVRGLASSLLASGFQKIPQRRDSKASGILSLIERAEFKMLRSGRADHADGFARLHAILLSVTLKQEYFESDENWWASPVCIVRHILWKLEEAIDLAKNKLSLAIDHYPMHGLLRSLR